MYNKRIAINVIDGVLELLSHPNTWIKGDTARGNHDYGVGVPPWSYTATRWSLLGAVEKIAYETRNYRYLLHVISELEKDCGKRLYIFNDNSSYEDVISLLRKSLKRLVV